MTIFKRSIAVIAVVCILSFVFSVIPFALTEDVYEYEVNPDELSVTITRYNGTETEPVTPVTLGGLAVTAIGDYAFANCHTVTSLTVSEGVVSLGNGAFYGNMNLTSLLLPSTLDSIGDEAFTSCSYLTSLSIPASVTKIGTGAFKQCFLLNITVESGNMYYKINNGVLMNKSGTSLVFYPHKTNKAYAVPSGVKTIEPWAFFANRSLEGVTFPTSLTEVKDHAFSSCTYLESANMKSTALKSIGEYAFSDCVSLVTVKAPDSLVSVGVCAFEEVPWVESSVTSGIVYLGKVALCYSGTMLFSTQKRIAPKSGTVQVAGEAFWWNPDITRFTAPSSLRSIGERAFTGCTAMTQVTLNDGLVSVGEIAFAECSGIESLTVPKSVTDIGANAFGMTWNDEAFKYVPASGFTLYCYFRSAAHLYAEANGINYVLLDAPKKGDYNNDGIVTTDDARLALRAAIGLEEPDEFELYVADVDGNGVITILDARSILRAALSIQSL